MTSIAYGQTEPAAEQAAPGARSARLNAGRLLVLLRSEAEAPPAAPLPEHAPPAGAPGQSPPEDRKAAAAQRVAAGWAAFKPRLRNGATRAAALYRRWIAPRLAIIATAAELRLKAAHRNILSGLREALAPAALARGARMVGRASLRHLVLPACIIAALITVGAHVLPREDDPPVTASIAAPVETPRAAADPAQQWLRLSRPVMLYSVDAPEFARLPAEHQARRHVQGNGREDRFTVGRLDSEQLYFAVRLYRPGGENMPATTLFVDTARRLAEDGLALTRMAAGEQHATKFGPALVADALVRTGAGDRTCLSFRAAAGDGVLDISGLACGTEKKPLDRAVLTCFIDRIVLMAAGEDTALRTVFAEAEQARHAGCTKSSLLSAGRKPNWLDVDGAVPMLKTSVPLKAETPDRPAAKRKKERVARN